MYRVIAKQMNRAHNAASRLVAVSSIYSLLSFRIIWPNGSKRKFKRQKWIKCYFRTDRERDYRFQDENNRRNFNGCI